MKIINVTTNDEGHAENKNSLVTTSEALLFSII